MKGTLPRGVTFYRVMYERGNVTGSYDMTQEFVEDTHKGSVWTAYVESAPDWMHDARPVSVERIRT